ncbi:exodeoxyribonuclease III [Patescibacteria group bacterium]
MKIYSWNVNGIRAAIRNGFFNWFNKAKPDILCLQEIKAQYEKIPDELKNLPGYYLYTSEAKKAGYSGTIILSKIKAKKITTRIGKPLFDNEGRFVLADFGKFKVFNTYFPHSQRELARLDFKLKFNQAYLNFIKKLDSKFLILTGDFNYAHKEIDLANPKQNEKNPGFTLPEREFGDKLEKLGWIDSFRYLHPKAQKYTWWTYRFTARQRNIGWRIDYFFIKKDRLKHLKKAEIHDKVKGSDHCPVSIELNL